MTTMPDAKLAAQTLLFDADDTLWENNVYFERAIAAFISYLDHRVHTPDEVRAQLNLCERATIAAHGYGVSSFSRSLLVCFEQLTAAPPNPDQRRRIVDFAESICAQDIELLPGIETTLRQLAPHHRLLLVTKGNRAEQTAKLERSGLENLFIAVEVPVEKDEAMYRGLAAKYGFDLGSTWMVGNSPRSDINPALAAGLNAIFIPHGMTWVLEHEVLSEPPPGQTVKHLTSLAELTEHFLHGDWSDGVQAPAPYRR